MTRFSVFLALSVLFPSLSAQVVVDSIIDLRDNQVYKVVRIGEQWWMQENLDIGTRIDGLEGATDNGIIEKYCAHDITGNCDVYGGLYQWDEVMNYHQSDVGNPGTTRGICPCGWHLPTEFEWVELVDYLGGEYVAGGKMKDTTTTHWFSPNFGATNESGFTGLPGGYRLSSGYNLLGYFGKFWSASSGGSDIATQQELWYNLAETGSGAGQKLHGYSVRCILDTSQFSYLVLTDIKLDPLSDLTMTLDRNRDTIVMINTNARKDITIISITTNGPAFSVSASSTSLSPGDSTHMIVEFDPPEKGVQYLDTIRIKSDDPFKPLITIPMMGYLPEMDSIVDIRDGQTYDVVRIGAQWWLQENLNIGTRIETDPSSISNGTIEKYCFNNDEGNCDVYGGLYSWFEAMDYSSPQDADTGTVQGICPPGWHMPTQTESEELKDFLGGFQVAGGKLKATGTDYWGDPNTGATNESGFTGLPGGRRSTSGTFASKDLYSYIWTATQYDPSNYRYWSMSWNKAWVTTGNDSWSYAHSVRCLSDTGSFSLLTVADRNFKTVSEINLSAGHPGDTILLINAGKANFIILTSIATNGPVFTLDKSSAVLWPGDSTTLTVLFTPAGIGHFTDSIRIESDDPYQPVIHIPLSAWSHEVDSITDLRDGQSYEIIRIEGEWWMQENLAVGSRIGQDENGKDNDTIEKKCYNDDPANCEVYGGLYQWDEMMDYNLPDYGVIGTTQGICPLGWHIPTRLEFDSLVVAIGSTDATGKLKEISDFHWKLPNSGATNETGFSALPGGVHETGTGYMYLGEQAQFWTSYPGRNLELYHDAEYTMSTPLSTTDANSIRCKRDPGPMSYLSVRSPDLETVSELVYYHPKTLDTIILVHSGAGQSLNISSIGTKGSAFSASKSNATILPGDSTLLLVTFSPPDTAIYYDTLTIQSDDPYIPVMNIPLFGTYPPEIEWTEVHNISCKGFDDGSVRIAPMLGAPPYTINWFGGTMYQDSTFTGMIPDWDYWVDITDSRKYKASDTIVLSEPDTLITTASYSDTICLNDSVGFIHSTPSGGTQPYQYAWSNGGSTASLIGLEAGDYQLVVTDHRGCTDTSRFSIESATPFGKEEICVVTVDLLTGRNVVVWESTPGRGIAHHNVYRENDLIGTVPYGNLSIFTDTVADPETRPFVYYISVTDTCGNESAKSLYHKPLFLQYVSSIDGVNLRWSKYEMEGGELSFDVYDIYRGSDSLSLSPFAQNIPTIVDVYTDKDSEALTKKYYYRVAGILTYPCMPTGSRKEGTAPYKHSLSNMDDNKKLIGTVLNEFTSGAVRIHPNPFSESAWVTFPNDRGLPHTLELYNLEGSLVWKITGITGSSAEIRRGSLERGLYVLKLTGPQVYTVKIAIE